jgi:hypothetical protein
MLRKITVTWFFHTQSRFNKKDMKIEVGLFGKRKGNSGRGRKGNRG